MHKLLRRPLRLVVCVPMLAAHPAISAELPNLVGLTVQDATKELTRAGVNARVEPNPTSQACPSVVEQRIIEIGQICAYWPTNTNSFSPSNRTVRVTVQQADPRGGNVGSRLEWRLMPNVVGMSLEQAKAELAKIGLANDKTQISRVVDSSCVAGVVCRTYPNANERSGVASSRVLYVGATRK